MTTKTRTRTNDTTRLVREAITWPTVREVAEEWNVPEQYVRSMIERRRVGAIRLDRIRIDPESWANYMSTVYRPGRS